MLIDLAYEHEALALAFVLFSPLAVLTQESLHPPPASQAQPAGGEEYKHEVLSLLDRAQSHIKENGKDKALTVFNDPNGPFVNNGLYVFAYDFYGVNKALATNPALVGKNLIDMKDANGKEIIKDMIALARSGGGWYDYKWEGHDKSSYVVKVDDTLWIGSGTYKNEAVPGEFSIWHHFPSIPNFGERSIFNEANELTPIQSTGVFHPTS